MESAANGGADLTHRMVVLVFQVAVIIFAVRIGGGLVKRVGLPSVLGELLAGIVIGPHALGGAGLPFFGFPEGLFPVRADFPVSPELYGLSVLASIILLFVSGLETDLRKFLKYSLAGTVIGLGGVGVSFLVGDLALVMGGVGGERHFFSPASLFMGALCTATSVGITARILSDRKKMDSPEGVTILAAAIIDDVLGIIGLAVIISLIDVLKADVGVSIPWGSIGLIASKTVGVWLGFTALGLFCAPSISRFLKLTKNPTMFTALALGMALFVAGIFEMAGLAMIIGSYVMGLSLSKTDITFVVQERMHSLYDFFVPIFFAVMGMLVDLKRLSDPKILAFGLILGLAAAAAKILGCALPALFVGFNPKGALRIGVGMIPRGEVALIIAGIGMTADMLDPDAFGAAIIMTLFTTIVAPPLLALTLNMPGKGARREHDADDFRQTSFNFPSATIADSAADTVLEAFRAEGFFDSMIDSSARLYQLRKDELAFSMWREENALLFSSSRRDVALIGTVVYEALVDLYLALERMRDLAKPREYRRTLSSNSSFRGLPVKEKRGILPPECVIMNMVARDKEAAIRELIDALAIGHDLKDKEAVLQAALEREEAVPTDMEFGVSLPHGRTDAVGTVMAAAGICASGMNYQGVDGRPIRLVVLTVSPKNTSGPHLQFLAGISGALRTAEMVERVVEAETPGEVVKRLVGTRGVSIVERIVGKKRD